MLGALQGSQAAQQSTVWLKCLSTPCVQSPCKDSVSLEIVLWFSRNRLLNVVRKTLLLHLHNCPGSSRRLQLASLPLCGASSSDTADSARNKVPGILGRARQEDNNLKEQNPQVNGVSITSHKPKLWAPVPLHPTFPQLLLRKHVSSWELHQNQAKYFAWEIWLDVNGEDIYSIYSSTF